MANFNNYGYNGYGFGTYPGYQQPMQQIPQQPQSQQVIQDERVWVANENAAEAYLVAPNSFVRLWDSNKNVFYEKRADATGRLYPMERYEYTKIEPNRAVKTDTPTIDYKKEIDSLNGRISVLEEAINNGKPDADNE